MEQLGDAKYNQVDCEDELPRATLEQVFIILRAQGLPDFRTVKMDRSSHI